MKINKIILTIPIFFSVINFSASGNWTDDSNGFNNPSGYDKTKSFDVEKWKNEVGKDFNVEEWKKLVDKDDEKDKGRGVRNQGKKVVKDIEKTIDVFDKASDIGINTAIGILQTSQSMISAGGIVSILGNQVDTAAPTQAIGDMIKTLQNVQTTKNQLKQIKNDIMRHKDLSPEELLTLNGLVNELNNASNIIKKSKGVYDEIQEQVCSKNPNSKFCKVNCTSNEISKGLCGVSKDIAESELEGKYINNMLDFIKGGTVTAKGKGINTIDNTIDSIKKSISNIQDKTSEQKLTKISKQLDILINLIEKQQIKEQELAEYKLNLDNKEAAKEKLRLERKRKQIEANNRYIQELKNKAKNTRLINNKRFSGDIYDGGE